MIKNFDDIQKLNQTGMDATMKMMGEWTKSWQTLTTEMTDYTKRAFEDSTSTMEKLMAAKSLEQALEIQTSYAKRSYEEYMQQMAKLGSMYTEVAKEAYRPVERAISKSR